VKIQARFAHDRLDHSKSNPTHLVVSVEAPALDWVEKRPSVAILPVIDLSGSMRGDKLGYAKKSVLKLIEHLQPGDVAGLVTFSDNSRIDVKPQPVTAKLKERLRTVVGKLEVEGGTNFADALVDSLDVIQNLDLPAKYLHRVIMFTDGEPTIGITDTKAILNLLKKKRVRATLSAFGYGEVGGGVWTGCDQDFLGELASLGMGNYAYVRDPDDALSAFGKELGGLLSTYATSLNIEISPVGGHQIKSLVTDVPHEQDVTGTVEIPVSDIMSEETRHFVLEVELGEQKNAFPRASTVFDVNLSYSVLTEEGKKKTLKLDTKAKVRFVKPGEEQKDPYKDLDEIISLAQMVKTQLEAEKRADSGDHVGAAHLMQQFGEQLHQNGYEGMAVAAQNMAEVVGDRGAYIDSAGYRRSMARGATRAYSVSSMDSDAAVHLADCNVSLSNSAMQGTVQSFTQSSSKIDLNGSVPMSLNPEVPPEDSTDSE
jgi:Ca-activated chloride channel homolog